VALRPGLVLAVGANGVGKTNLLEALHVGTQGFSPRTRAETQLVRFGAPAARVIVRGRRGAAKLEVDVALGAGVGKQAKLNGATLRAAEQLRAEAAVLVFTPDRLGIVKGAPAARRAYFDRVAGRLMPARSGLPAEYGAAVAQRNAALRRAVSGFSSREAVAPWTEQVVTLGAELAATRRAVLGLLREPFAERAGELGLAAAALRYEGEPPTRDALEERLARDLERGVTSLGPHLDDVIVLAGARPLRSFGSQGEQRLAVLALLLAEAEVIADRRGVFPLLLLDDVLSELDRSRRGVLAARVAASGQTLVTATDASMLPLEPQQLLAVAPGRVLEAAA
jgi:DNA replication and repair protein RecF